MRKETDHFPLAHETPKSRHSWRTTGLISICVIVVALGLSLWPFFTFAVMDHMKNHGTMLFLSRFLQGQTLLSTPSSTKLEPFLPIWCRLDPLAVPLAEESGKIAAEGRESCKLDSARHMKTEEWGGNNTALDRLVTVDSEIECCFSKISSTISSNFGKEMSADSGKKNKTPSALIKGDHRVLETIIGIDARPFNDVCTLVPAWMDASRVLMISYDQAIARLLNESSSSTHRSERQHERKVITRYNWWSGPRLARNTSHSIGELETGAIARGKVGLGILESAKWDLQSQEQKMTGYTRRICRQLDKREGSQDLASHLL